MKFVALAITINSVYGQSCGVQESVQVTSSTYPEANGCYAYTGLYDGYPSFGTTTGAIIPYKYDVGGSGLVITRWVWAYASSPFKSCDLNVINGALTGSNPANGAQLTGFASAGTGGDCKDVEVEFSCGCGATKTTEPEPEQCESFTLSGGDTSLGYAGGVSGFPSIDGCYTKKYLNYFTGSGNEKELYLNYVKFDTSYSDKWETKGPRFVNNPDAWKTGRSAWTLAQFPSHGDDDDVDKAVDAQGVMYAYSTALDPTGVNSWLDWENASISGFSMTCGCAGEESESEDESIIDTITDDTVDFEDSSESIDDDDSITYWDRVDSGFYDSDSIESESNDGTRSTGTGTSGTTSSGNSSGSIIAMGVGGSIAILGVLTFIVYKIRVKLRIQKRKEGNQLSQKSSKSSKSDVDVEIGVEIE